MRRALLVAVVALVALTSACSSEQRPEGITERWLLSLNQGAAGQPDRYAPDEVSEQVVPGWHDLDPGFLDVITVEPQVHSRSAGPVPGAFVPFRLVTNDGGRDRWPRPSGAGRGLVADQLMSRQARPSSRAARRSAPGSPGGRLRSPWGRCWRSRRSGSSPSSGGGQRRPETRKSRPEGRPVRCSQVHGEGARVGDQLPSPRGMGFGCPGVVTLPIEGTGRDIRENREKVPKKRPQ